ncbi:MAG: hypothetical protein IJ655_10440, partial [Lachnospiraceae bacterium]|nr:hypothetical protein [Lachnospiraceae bacterium]
MSSYKVDYATLYGLYNDIKSARDTVKKNITAHKKAMMNLANTEAFKSNTSKGIAAFIGDIYPYCEKVYHQVVEEIYTSYVEYFQTYLNSIDTDNSAH